MSKKRLDLLLTERGLAQSRSRARALIMAGSVLVNGVRVDKAGSEVPEEAEIIVKSKDHPYVSRGGVKLEHALKEFSINPKGMICLDVGSSTGGFTDCLLQHGAGKVWAVDVGSGQMDYRLRVDERVVLLEGVNAREIDPAVITDLIDLLVADVSFISLRLVVPPLLDVLKDDAALILLVKPQFEAGRSKVGKRGVVKDRSVHREVVRDLVSFFESRGLRGAGLCPSPIRGRKGNVEYFLLLKAARGGGDEKEHFDLDNVIKNN